MSALELVLSRLASPRQQGPDRWRAACPACGGRNRSTLSVGARDTGAVLLKCWKEGCGPETIAAALGLQVEDLFPPREATGSSPRRRRLLSAQQALELLDAEANLVFTAAGNIAAGLALDDEDLSRVTQARARIGYLLDEVRS